MQLVIPKDYDPILDVRQTQEAIKYIRDTFQRSLEERCIYLESPLHCSFQRVLV